MHPIISGELFIRIKFCLYRSHNNHKKPLITLNNKNTHSFSMTFKTYFKQPKRQHRKKLPQK